MHKWVAGLLAVLLSLSSVSALACAGDKAKDHKGEGTSSSSGSKKGT
jgi:hypothetical protein